MFACFVFVVTQCVDMWRQNSCQLSVPKEIDVSAALRRGRISSRGNEREGRCACSQVEKYAVVEKSLQLEDSQPNTVIWPVEVRAFDRRASETPGI